MTNPRYTYASTEESMVDWGANMKDKKHWHHKVVLEDVDDDDAMIPSSQVSEEEHKAIDKVIVGAVLASRYYYPQCHTMYHLHAIRFLVCDPRCHQP